MRGLNLLVMSASFVNQSLLRPFKSAKETGDYRDIVTYVVSQDQRIKPSTNTA